MTTKQRIAYRAAKAAKWRRVAEMLRGDLARLTPGKAMYDDVEGAAHNLLNAAAFMDFINVQDLETLALEQYNV